MKRANLNLPLLVTLALCVVSCSKDVLVEDGPSAEPNSTLCIRTRIGNGLPEGEKVSYPVNIYVFDSDGVCCEYVQVTEDEPAISMTLLEGTYTVYALAGAGLDQYGLPTKENASGKTVVSLLGDSHGDLMSAQNVVTLVEGGENMLTLTLQRKVMLIQDVTMNNIPSTVSAVSITIAPVYESICIDGGYHGENGLHTIDLSRDGESRVWRSAGNQYVLPPSGENTTITVNITGADKKVSSYSYTSREELRANYKINITGTYTERLGVELGGTIVGATWDGESDIIFDFDEGGSSIPSGGGSDHDGDDGVTDRPDGSATAPEVGTIYDDKYYVLKSEGDGMGGTVVTLMTAYEMSGLGYAPSDQEDIREVVNAAIVELSAGSGITGWRLPTKDEIIMVDNDLAGIRDALRNANKDDLSMDRYVLYLFESDDTICGYSFRDRHESQTLYGNEILRAFVTVRF